jgi:hypothetical protein
MLMPTARVPALVAAQLRATSASLAILIGAGAAIGTARAEPQDARTTTGDRVELAKLPFGKGPQDVVTLAVGPCRPAAKDAHPGECALRVTLANPAMRAPRTAYLSVPAVPSADGRVRVTERDGDPFAWHVEPGDSKVGEVGGVDYAVRSVRLGKGRFGLLVTTTAGYEHIRHVHELVVVDHEPRIVWSEGGERFDTEVTTVAAADLNDDGADELIVERRSYGRIVGEHDAWDVQLWAWSDGAKKPVRIEPKSKRYVRSQAFVVGSFKTFAAAEAERKSFGEPGKLTDEQRGACDRVDNALLTVKTDDFPAWKHGLYALAAFVPAGGDAAAARARLAACPRIKDIVAKPAP